MKPARSGARNAGFTLCSAMVAALLSGCAGQSPLARAATPPAADGAPRENAGAPVDKALAKAEARVAKAPHNAAARVQLAQAYFAAGRFASAATTFEDAAALGDEDARNGLSLALSYIGAGRNAEALSVLSRWRDRIPAGDFGLAVALAGQPAEAVQLLSDTLRGGENTAKVRQNLAYAYALDGRWAQARIVAMQDVPGDQIDARIAEWAAQARPGQSQARVAGLLGTPLRGDPGQPVALALGSSQPAPRMAMAEVPSRPVPAPAPVAELPAVERDEPMWGASAPVIAPAPAIERAPVAVPRRSTTIERAFAAAKPAARKAAPQGSHLVQLGSFTTMEGAKRAWGIHLRNNPALRDHAMRITEAQVNGRRYFRVAAEGFDRGSAEGLCSTMRGKGASCLAYADTQARPAPARGPRLARGM